MIKAIFFDVDGTLIDSNDIHAAAWDQAFRHFDIDLSRDRIRHEVGKGGDNLIPSLLGQIPSERQEEIEQYRSELFKRDYLPSITPFPGVRPLFERIVSEGKRIYLATSSNQDELDYFIGLTGARDLVTGSVTRSDAEHSKPDPDIFAAALSKAEVSADEALAIGDTPWDAIAAGKVGLRTIGFRSGGFADDELTEAGAVALYDGPQDLLAGYEASLIARG